MQGFGQPKPNDSILKSTPLISQLNPSTTFLGILNKGIPPSGASSLFSNSNPISTFTPSQNSFQTSTITKFQPTSQVKPPSLTTSSVFQPQMGLQQNTRSLQSTQVSFPNSNLPQFTSQNFPNTGNYQIQPLFRTNTSTQGFQQKPFEGKNQGNFQVGGIFNGVSEGFIQSQQGGFSTKFELTICRDADQCIKVNNLIAMEQFNRFQIQEVRFQDYFANKTSSNFQGNTGQNNAFSQSNGNIQTQSSLFPQDNSIQPLSSVSQNPFLISPAIGNPIVGNSLQKNTGGVFTTSLFSGNTQNKPGSSNGTVINTGNSVQPQTESSLFPSTEGQPQISSLVQTNRTGLGFPQIESSFFSISQGLTQHQTDSSLFPYSGGSQIKTFNSQIPNPGKLEQPETRNSLFPTEGQGQTQTGNFSFPTRGLVQPQTGNTIFPLSQSSIQPEITSSQLLTTCVQSQQQRESSLISNIVKPNPSLLSQSNQQTTQIPQMSFFPAQSSPFPSAHLQYLPIQQPSILPQSSSSFSPNQHPFYLQTIDKSISNMTTAYKDPSALSLLFPDERPETLITRYNYTRTPQYEPYSEIQRIIQNRQTPFSSRSTQEKWRNTLNKKFYSAKSEIKSPMITPSRSYSSFNFKTKVPPISYKSAVFTPIQSDYFNLVVNCFDPDLTRMIFGVSAHTKIKELQYSVMNQMKSSGFKTVQLICRGRVLIDNETIGQAQITYRDQVNVVKIDYGQSNIVERVSQSFLPKLKRPGYFTYPSMVQISRMTLKQLQKIEKFTIGNKFGKIVFLQKVNLVNLDLDSIVSIQEKSVILYPDEVSYLKHPKGEGLNKPAVIHLYRCFSSKNMPNSLFQAKMKRVCEKDGTQFLSWNSTTGEWIFKSYHF